MVGCSLENWDRFTFVHICLNRVIDADLLGLGLGLELGLGLGLGLRLGLRLGLMLVLGVGFGLYCVLGADLSHKQSGG